MKRNDFTNLSFADLRDRLKMRADGPDKVNDLDINEALRFLVTLPDEKQTAQSVDALLQLGKNFHYAAQPTQVLKVASHAARLAVILGDNRLLYRARALQGVSLSDLGKFSEAMVAQVASWSLARELQDKKWEVCALGNVGTLCGGMGQWNAAARYFERSRELAQENGFDDLELQGRNNLGACAVELQEPTFGLRALSQLGSSAPATMQNMALLACTHNTLARLHLLVGDLRAARTHAEKSASFARATRMEKTIRSTEAVLGLIDVSSGETDRGLSAVESALTFAKVANQTEAPQHLSMCIDACEIAGHSDRALAHLHDLVAWKKKSIDIEIMPLQYDGLAESIQFQTGSSLFDDGLLARAYLLHADVQDRVQRFVELAVNAEITAGYDLYRTFRVAKLSRCLAAAVGWEEQRIPPLSLGAQLCNIGMMAIPARVLQKRQSLSAGERHVVHDHARYGAELLRKSKLRTLDIAGVIAEQHHERYDGRGYPRGLAGEAIAKEARIVAICDAFDAMTHARPWRAIPLSIPAALNELNDAAGTQFDPRFVGAFIDLMHRELREHENLDAFLAEGADEVEYVRARARMEALLSERQ